ncbi:hypothetical protein [Pedobacter sp. NJ-S-72]
MKRGLLLFLLLFVYRVQAQEIVYDVKIGTASKYKKDPTPRLAMYLAFDLIFPDRYLPLQLFKLTGVKVMKIESPADPARNFVIVFNRKGQWIEMRTVKDTLSVTYKDGAPHEFISHSGRFNQFYYSGDTVISVRGKTTERYIRKGRIFHKVNEQGDKLALPVTIYSNTNWDLPLTIHYKEHPDDDEMNFMTDSFFKDEHGNLILDKTLYTRRAHLVFQMENGLPLTLSTFKQRLSGVDKSVKESDQKPDLLNFSYEYFEKEKKKKK